MSDSNRFGPISKTDQTAIAPVEDGTTASKAYASGSHFMRDGQYCTAIAAIAQGASFTLNTNYTVGDVEDYIFSLESRLTSLNTAFYAEKNTYPQKMGQFTFTSGQTRTLTGYASSWRIYLISQHWASIHGLCMITVYPGGSVYKTDIGGVNTHLTFSISGNDLIIKSDTRINSTIIFMGTP